MSTLLRSAAAGLIATTALTASTTVQQPPAAAQSVSAMPASYESAVLRQINLRRTARGLRPLRAGGCVDRYAESRSRRMAVNDVLVHLGGLRNALSGCDATMVGEVIGRGRGFRDASRIVRSWMGSGSHRDVLLTKRFRNAGVGAWRDNDGTVYVSVVFRAP
ncbi:hypothetical protein ASE01_15920 [Nocardioides sp. Root190]|uniref:CAP domain-containing protein n=1 Tax=Nocardioides sp. Root190 TaxID=1736488 RepID=UPI0006FBF97D|nr:CAP domain-containing protein [Nocardioides sp. Root190]KRB76449.1 hypothetical protein ASE01_15920 [Nocardioides sp. Root190]